MKTYTIKTNAVKINGFYDIPQIESVDISEQDLKDLIKNNPELLTPTPTHKRKYFVPEYDKSYWYINYDDESSVIEDLNMNYAEDKFRRLSGNCFATEQDAQDELNRRQALVRIWNNYDDKYSWDIDWENNSKRFEISFDYEYKVFYTGEYTHSMIHSTELPYFKSAKDRNQFVESNKEDLLVMFNIKTK